MIRRVVLAVAAFAAFGGFLSIAPAEAEAKPKWKHGHHGHHGYHRGGPPSWAPAHGYRRKHQRGYSYRRSFDGPRWRY